MSRRFFLSVTSMDVHSTYSCSLSEALLKSCLNRAPEDLSEKEREGERKEMRSRRIQEKVASK